MSKFTWIARPDKTGWASSRTRDFIDCSFVVLRETSDKRAVLKVRFAAKDGETSRARDYVGQFYFANHKAAKAQALAALAYANLTNDGTKSHARTVMLQTLLDQSYDYIDDASSGEKKNAWGILATESTPVVAPPMTEPVVIEKFDPSTIVGEVDSYTLIRHEPDETVFKTTAWVEVDRTETLTAYEPVHVAAVASEIIERISEVKETVEPAFDPRTWSVGDPVPAGYVRMGTGITKIGWPS